MKKKVRLSCKTYEVITLHCEICGYKEKVKTFDPDDIQETFEAHEKGNHERKLKK